LVVFDVSLFDRLFDPWFDHFKIFCGGSSVNARISAISNARELTGKVSAIAIVACVFGLLLLPAGMHAQNTINTYAGGGTAGGAALSIDLPGPTAAVRDSAGNTYFTAPYSTYVFKMSNGTVTTYAGTGVEGFGGDGGQSTSAILALPSGLTLDGKGNLYIADFGTARIRMVNTTTGVITTIAGSGTRCEPATGTCGDGGPATSAAFNFPLGVALDANGNVYVADAFDNRVRAINMGTTAVTIFGVKIQPGNIAAVAGNGVPCATPIGKCGDGGTPVGPTLNYPQSVAFDSAGNLYIADTRDNKIRMIAPAASPVITTVAGNGSTCVPVTKCGDGGPATAANLYQPMSVFIDLVASNIYIADTFGNKIRLVSGGNISTIAGTGAQGFAGDGAVATSALLNRPESVFLDSSGNLIIADQGNERIRQISGGNISTIAGGGLGNDGGPASNAILADPFNLTEDSSGNLYIADTLNNRIRFINASTHIISTFAGTGNAGYTGDSGPATSATLDGPTGVAIDSAGDVFIADTNNQVIREVLASTGNIITYAGTGKSCALGNPTNPCGDNGPATSATFTDPMAIALDSSNNLYIADYSVHRVREVNASTQIITTIAGVGIAGKGGNGGPATAAHLDHPSGVVVGSTGNVYIDDSYNNEIRCIGCLGPGYINDFALNTAFSLTGDGGPATGASMWAPMELALDPAGDLFIGGGNDNVVQRVSAATGIIGTVAGDYAQKGVGGFSGDGGPATSAKISNDGLVVDAQGNLYIADAGNNRIRLVQLSPALTNTNPSNFASYPIGTSSPAQNLNVMSAGGADLSLTGISLGGNDPQDFAETTTCGGGTLPALIAVDVTCQVAVTFTPVNYGKRTATLQFTDNALNSPQTVNLIGFGPYFTVSNSPTSLKILPGGSNTTTVTVAPFGQFNQGVNLSCSGLPAQTTCSFATNPVTPNGTSSATSVLTVQTSTGTPGGTYVITVTGAFGPQSQLQWSAQLQLIIK
jgi:sugar lactone lactonase YvrE